MGHAFILCLIAICSIIYAQETITTTENYVNSTQEPGSSFCTPHLTSFIYTNLFNKVPFIYESFVYILLSYYHF